MTGLSYRKDVAFLEDCNPALVERNADEFKRLHDMLIEVDTPAERAEKRTHWYSEGSQHYVSRLVEARKLMQHTAEGYGRAASALRSYAWALETAKSHYSDGKANERSLAALIGTKGTAITREAQDAEPMRQWEDMRATTGVLDFFAELTMDVDDIRGEANRLHDAAGSAFHLAGTTEKEARDLCVHGLKQAYELLPEFRMGSVQRVDIVSAIASMRSEAKEAGSNPLTHLPGSPPSGTTPEESAPTRSHRRFTTFARGCPPCPAPKTATGVRLRQARTGRTGSARTRRSFKLRRRIRGCRRTWSPASPGRRSVDSPASSTTSRTRSVSRPTPPGG
ncbi:hypothetical protein ACF05T_04450 [Streptomyces lateritius]|uniref:Uncharacterized protein n=1 Tax=Streptomyces lateritius TaxID=67313 RepID=A0ABW6Y6C1_9ACTN